MPRDNALIPLVSLGYFTGIDNVADSVRMVSTPIKNAEGFKSAYPLTEAVNVDIDNTYALSSRDGSTIKVSGTDIHSGWAKNNTGFFVDGTNLYLLNTDYSVTLLLSGLTKGVRMSYVPVNDRIYMTNGSYIGYYKNLSMNAISDPGINYKLPLPAGRFIAYFRGITLVAKGKILYISDALCDHYDIRTGFRVFENNITMLRPVIDGGVYVADGNTWFLSEKRSFADDSADFRKDNVLDIDAIPYTDIEIDGKDVGEGVDGNFAMWVSTDGICLGDSKGAVKVLTKNKYYMDPKGTGTATLRNVNGVIHYLATLE